MNPNKPAKKLVVIHEDEVPLLLKVAVCEAVLGYVRSRGRDGLTWEGVDVKTGEPGSFTEEALPEFAQDGSLAMALFAKFATDHDFVPRLWIDNRAHEDTKACVHVEVVERPKKPGGKVRPMTRVSASNVPRAVCRAACELYDVDMQRLHRDLFPGRYLMVVG